MSDYLHGKCIKCGWSWGMCKCPKSVASACLGEDSKQEDKDKRRDPATKVQAMARICPNCHDDHARDQPCGITVPPHSSDQLLPCPFCGSKPDRVVDTVTGGLEIACTNPCCWAKPKVTDEVGIADRLWNTRNDDRS